MKIVQTSIRRPVSVAVGVLLVALFGLVSLFRIPIQLIPDVDRPVVTVNTLWPGASPEEVEREIVQRQEEQLKSLQGLVEITSESADSYATVRLEFAVGVDPDATLLKVSNKLNQVSGYPRGRRAAYLRPRRGRRFRRNYMDNSRPEPRLRRHRGRGKLPRLCRGSRGDRPRTSSWSIPERRLRRF